MIGQPINRVDGPLKATGTAIYAYEEWSFGQPLYGYIVSATIGHGRIAHIDTTPAQRSPGVRLVITHLNSPAQGEPDLSIQSQYSRAYPFLKGSEIQYHGEPVALVVAETFEQARAAAALVEVEYQVEIGYFDLVSRKNHAFVPETVNAGLPGESAVGDFKSGFATSPIKIDQFYTTPYYFSQPMEPHNCLAVWRGDSLILHLSSQIVGEARTAVSSTFGIDPKQVKVISRFVGGGFGSKLGIHAETILAVMAARQLKQPVKVAATRQQIFQIVGHRSATLQHVRIGSDSDGRLIAFGHDVTMQTGIGANYIEQTATCGRGLYAAPHRLTRHRSVELHLPRGEDVRAPGEAPGLLAIESAIDELAHTLGMDPLELRIKNEPKLHPEQGIPFSDRRLVECMREGARKFGWDVRPKQPASLRGGQWLVGYGMAAAIRGHFQLATEVRVRMNTDGSTVVHSDMTDIGTGTYTILAQVAAETLSVPIERVRVELGDSDFPPSPGSGGSWGATNSTTSLYAACRALIMKLITKLVADEKSPLHGLDAGSVVVSGGRIGIGTLSEDLIAVIARHFPGGIEATGSIPNMDDDPNYAAYSLCTYGAHFAEIGVDVDTCEIRLRRMLGVFTAGRILNHKTARSQLLGGMIWGLSAALYEEGVVDRRNGAFVNRDFAQYLIPVHADVPFVDVLILDSFDDKANVLGAKGLGELGICGAGAAIANAVFNATGIRVRDFPITIEKILRGFNSGYSCQRTP